MNNTQNNPNKKPYEKKSDTSSGDERKEAEVRKAKEENKNSPDNFGSLRHQKGAVEEGGRKYQGLENDAPEKDDHLGEPQYRDSILPRTEAERTEH